MAGDKDGLQRSQRKDEHTSDPMSILPMNSVIKRIDEIEPNQTQ